MIQKDKFENPIYPHVFNKLKVYENKLLELGFAESIRKPNLFFKKTENVIMFADMRGTEEVPIWSEPVPLIYFKELNQLQKWKINRIKENLLRHLDKRNINYRFSFHEEFCNSKDYSYCNLCYKQFTENGYCILCKKDFQANGLFCSEECELKHKEADYEEKFNYEKRITGHKKCYVCKRSPNVTGNLKTLQISVEQFVEHHTSYKQNVTISVCRSCHSRIHKDKEGKYTEFKPDIDRREWLKEKNEKILSFISKNNPYRIDLVSFISNLYNKNTKWAEKRINKLILSGIIKQKADWKFYLVE